MSIFVPNVGLPGLGTVRRGQTRHVSIDGVMRYKPNGGVMHSKTRDVFNPLYSTETNAWKDIRPGVLMGKQTSGGRYINSVIGVSTAAVLANATSITVSVASALHLVERVGTSGNIIITAPPTANGTVARQTVAYTSVNTSTGAIATGTIAAACVAGAIIGTDDGSSVPVTYMTDGAGLFIPDVDADVEYPQIIVGAYVDDTKIVPWPTDTSLQAWIRSSLGPDYMWQSQK